MLKQAAQQPNLRTLVLRSEDDCNLYYVVELEQASHKQVFYRGENYRQAAFVAEKIYNWLKSNSALAFDIIVEEEHGLGVLYTSSSEVEEFPSSMIVSEDIYHMIADEFSSLKMEQIHDLNGLFRELVNKYKLNEYQERKLLETLKELNYV